MMRMSEAKYRAMLALLEESRREHDHCYDSWFCCGKCQCGDHAGEYPCSHDGEGARESGVCNCGADTWNEKVDAVLALATVDDAEQRLRDMVCPQCLRPFELTWNEYGFKQKPMTLMIRGCPSGGIYDVRISCPHCDYEEEL